MTNPRAILLFLLLVCALNARAQGPRINALFPAGAKAGDTVDVAVRGGNLVGGRRVLVTGTPGVTAELVGTGNQVDESARPLFQSKCTTCHEPRSPANRTMSPEQWASTVDRMITARGADIGADDKKKIVGYLQALSRAGEIRARVHVAPDAAPGMREFRLLTDHGASTAWSFEVGSLPEVACSGTNSKASAAQKVALPVVVNGVYSQSGERQFFTFDAKKGQRLSFGLKAYRLNAQSAGFFNPALYLYDAGGREVAKNLGRFGTDPVIDWVAPEDGTYTLLLRDLIWHGTPASIYRLTMGGLSADGVLSPAAARPGASLAARMVTSSMPALDGSAESLSVPFSIHAPEGMDGLTTLSTPMGDAPFLVRDLPDGGEPGGASGSPITLPALFRGHILQAGQADVFHVTATRGGGSLEVYAHRLGSPLRAHVVIKNAKGGTITDRMAQGDEEDLRLPNAFPSAGEYTVEISDADSGAGPSYSYYWESNDGTPDYALNLVPDLVNLSPGVTTALTVRAVRRENVRGPITVSLQGLPPGVTATDAILLPGMNEAVLTVTAAATAAVGGQPVTVTARTTDEKGAAVVRRPLPLEIYRVNNNQHLMPRASVVVAVTADPALFTLSVAEGPNAVYTLAPGQETQIHVHVQRAESFKGDLSLLVLGLPPGITTRNVTPVPGKQSDAVVTLRAAGDAPLLRDKPAAGSPPARIVIGGYIGGNPASFDGAPLASTPPLTLAPK